MKTFLQAAEFCLLMLCALVVAWGVGLPFIATPWWVGALIGLPTAFFGIWGICAVAEAFRDVW